MYRTMTSLTDAIGTTIFTIYKQESSPPDTSFGFLWGYAKDMLKKQVEPLIKSAMPLEVAEKLVTHILDYQNQLEQLSIQMDMDSFIAMLRKKVRELQALANQPHSFTDTIWTIDVLDHKFQALGKDSTDAFKDSDKVIVGAQGEFITSLRKEAQRLAQSIPLSDEITFGFLTAFVNANAKERKRSAWRSPFEDSTYRDGYVQVSLRLHGPLVMGGWSLRGDTGTLHCPNAGPVAKALMENSSNFSLAKLDTEIELEIEADDDSRSHLPPLWGSDRAQTIRLDSIHRLKNENKANVWRWIKDATGQDTELILGGIRKIWKG